ncbi:MAG: hypothetical protein Q8O99_01765 [bacterium]|nr:hypothetical protein [bacterium]
MTVNSSDVYAQDVIAAGNAISENFKDQTGDANLQYSRVALGNMLTPDNALRYVLEEHATQVILSKDTIDGVGTKVEIYMHQFENEYQKMKQGLQTAEECKAVCTELCYRMLCDLVAMNVDDLRNGELGATITDIIDINHLRGERGQLFKIAMSEAMVKVIKETGLAITAGETAVVGEPSKVRFMYQVIQEMSEKITTLLNNVFPGFDSNKTQILEAL